MANTASSRHHSSVLTPLPNESLDVGVDSGKHAHMAGFISITLKTKPGKPQRNRKASS
jgi:hypothetical protein